MAENQKHQKPMYRKSKAQTLVDSISAIDAVLNAAMNSKTAKNIIGCYQNGEMRSISDAISGEVIDPETRAELKKRRESILLDDSTAPRPTIEVTIGEKKKKKKHKKKKKYKNTPYIDLVEKPRKKKKKKKKKKSKDSYLYY